MATTIRDNSYTAKPQLAAYRYDQLNRIKQMQTYQSITSNAWGATSTNAYKEVYSYDANGNIKTLERRNETGTIIDQLDYRYNKDASNHLVNNRLNYIDDPIPDGTSTYDVDGQSLNNYGYDEIGNLKSDVKERIGEIKWNVYGKVSEIIRERNTTNTASDLAFVYDAMGNRVCKIEKPYNYLTNPTGWLYTFYVRDASGNIMSTYKKTGDQIEDAVITLDEVMLYGSSRVGVRQVGKTIAQLEAETSLYLFNRRLGLKRYEMTNHLGNVLTTFTDRKYQVQSSGMVTGYKTYITSAQDYYAFGMGMNLRSWNASSYRFGFGGKEKDDEVKGSGNSLDFGARIYDSRVGRFWVVDAHTSLYTGISPYSYCVNNPIIFIDPDGNKIKVAFDNNGYNEFSTAVKNMFNNNVVLSTKYDRYGYAYIDFDFSKGKSEKDLTIEQLAVYKYLKDLATAARQIDVTITDRSDGGNWVDNFHLQTLYATDINELESNKNPLLKLACVYHFFREQDEKQKFWSNPEQQDKYAESHEAALTEGVLKFGFKWDAIPFPNPEKNITDVDFIDKKGNYMYTMRVIKNEKDNKYEYTIYERAKAGTSYSTISMWRNNASYEQKDENTKKHFEENPVSN